MDKLIAHTRNDLGEWHYLVDHLSKVANRASQNTAYFRLDTPAYWIGLWHDLGKANPDFQNYLKQADQGVLTSSVPHAFGGAALLFVMLWRQQRNDIWKELALPIAGHHAGLHDAGTLATKLDAYANQHEALLEYLFLFAKSLPTPPPCNSQILTAHQREQLMRMSFSALVDSDYLDTETHFNIEQANSRAGAPDFVELWRRFDANQTILLSEATSKQDTNKGLIETRKEIYDACLSAASSAPGIFRLTVPTGGGKTRSGLAFALRHLLQNRDRLRRVIVAIPYTSIIDQTAREYRRIFGHDAVLEHHSQVPIPESEAQTREQVRLRLASENWDAPVIVTTNVQLFESLFSNKPGKVRRLHNIAGSIIILDEAQTLPVGMLAPVLEVLHTLVEQYNVSVVLSSATQPAFHNISGITPTDIVPRPRFEEHFKRLARVDFTVCDQKLSWSDLAKKLRDAERSQVMVVLNSRKDALHLLDQLQGADHVFHLSTLLCGWHRKAVLRLIRRRLRNGMPVLLVSTQVVEAGVDIDFPEVWRALGPLDRIVQAAGRCNREGKLRDGSTPIKGRVVIFEPADGRMPKGEYAAGFGLAEYLLRQNAPERLHDPSLHEEYFSRLYAGRDLDECNVQRFREVLNFPETAKQFRLIAEDTVLVVVDYGHGERRLADWTFRPSRITWRRLQPYAVSIQRREADRLAKEDWLEPVSEDMYRWIGKYDRIKGLVDALYDPADLIT